MTARLLTAALVVCSCLRAGAQSPTTSDVGARKLAGWLVGASLGVPGYRQRYSPEMFTLGVNATAVRPGRLGADWSIGTMPTLLQNGLSLGLRAGVALPIAAAPHLLVIPSAGFTVVAAFADNAAAGLPGYNAGLATVAHAGSVGLRTGVTMHSLAGARGSFWLLEVGLVHVPIHRS